MSLPSGYARLEYIQSSGTQYINTGFTPNNNTRVVCRFQLMDSSEEQTMFMSRPEMNKRTFGIFHNASGWNIDYGNSRATGATEVAITDLVNLDFNKNIATLNGVTLSVSAQTWSGTVPLMIFTRNTGGTLSNYAIAKLWSFKIYDDSTLVRDYIPCKNASGAVGLWDDVTEEFYGNSGTGAFSAGPRRVQLPAVISAKLSPNPATVGEAVLLQVAAIDVQIVEQTEVRASGEFRAGEV